MFWGRGLHLHKPTVGKKGQGELVEGRLCERVLTGLGQGVPWRRRPPVRGPHGEPSRAASPALAPCTYPPFSSVSDPGLPLLRASHGLLTGES